MIHPLGLEKDEKILRTIPPSKIIVFRNILAIVIVIAIIGILGLFFMVLFDLFILGCIAIVVLTYKILKGVDSLALFITNKRVVVVQGGNPSKTHSMGLESVKEVTVYRTPLGKLLDYYSITIIPQDPKKVTTSFGLPLDKERAISQSPTTYDFIDKNTAIEIKTTLEKYKTDIPVSAAPT